MGHKTPQHSAMRVSSSNNPLQEAGKTPALRTPSSLSCSKRSADIAEDILEGTEDYVEEQPHSLLAQQG